MALKYYQLLNIQRNQDNIKTFTHFINNIYKKQIINDYIHVLDQHSDDLENIHNQLLNDNHYSDICKVSDCSIIDRHYNTKRRMGRKPQQIGSRYSNKRSAKIERSKQHPEIDDIDHDLEKFQENTDGNILFYCDLLDNIHHFLFHLFEIGVRIKTTDDEMKEYYNNNYNHDALFYKLSLSIKEKKFEFDSKINRFKNKQNNKYKINLINKNGDDAINDNEGNGETFVDSLFKYITKNKQQNADIESKLYSIISEHEYDTDSLKMDLEIENESNIINLINDQICGKLMIRYIKQEQCLVASFVCLSL